MRGLWSGVLHSRGGASGLGGGACVTIVTRLAVQVFEPGPRGLAPVGASLSCRMVQQSMRKGRLCHSPQLTRPPSLTTLSNRLQVNMAAHGAIHLFADPAFLNNYDNLVRRFNGPLANTK